MNRCHGAEILSPKDISRVGSPNLEDRGTAILKTSAPVTSAPGDGGWKKRTLHSLHKLVPGQRPVQKASMDGTLI
jgi:hypothetical protein